jgi:hypothetical protein
MLNYQATTRKFFLKHGQKQISVQTQLLGGNERFKKHDKIIRIEGQLSYPQNFIT